jgi:hypothetical protein
MWESCLSGSVRGWSATLGMGAILWHRRETRRLTEKTNRFLSRGASPSYSKIGHVRICGDYVHNTHHSMSLKIKGLLS